MSERKLRAGYQRGALEDGTRIVVRRASWDAWPEAEAKGCFEPEPPWIRPGQFFRGTLAGVNDSTCGRIVGAHAGTVNIQWHDGQQTVETAKWLVENCAPGPARVSEAQLALVRDWAAGEDVRVRCVEHTSRPDGTPDKRRGGYPWRIVSITRGSRGVADLPQVVLCDAIANSTTADEYLHNLEPAPAEGSERKEQP